MGGRSPLRDEEPSTRSRGSHGAGTRTSIYQRSNRRRGTDKACSDVAGSHDGDDRRKIFDQGAIHRPAVWFQLAKTETAAPRTAGGSAGGQQTKRQTTPRSATRAHGFQRQAHTSVVEAVMTNAEPFTPGRSLAFHALPARQRWPDQPLRIARDDPPGAQKWAGPLVNQTGVELVLYRKTATGVGRF